MIHRGGRRPALPHFIDPARKETMKKLTREQYLGRDAVARFNLMRVPEMAMIGRGRDTATLYKLESQRNEKIAECAREWARLRMPEAAAGPEYWHKAAPQALFDTLLSYTPDAACLAAETYLKLHGWEVTRPAVDNDEDTENNSASPDGPVPASAGD
jgi:hypothetical protein